MVLRDRILRSLRSTSFPSSNRELALQVDAPEPSVRRMTRILNEDGLLVLWSMDPVNRYRLSTLGALFTRYAE